MIPITKPNTKLIDATIDLNLKEIIALIALLRWSAGKITDPDLPKLYEKLTTLLTQVGLMHPDSTEGNLV